MEALLDVNAAARLLAVSPWTIRAYVRNGKLRPVRIGRLVRLDPEELVRFVSDNKDHGEMNDEHQQEGIGNGR